MEVRDSRTSRRKNDEPGRGKPRLYSGFACSVPSTYFGPEFLNSNYKSKISGDHRQKQKVPYFLNICNSSNRNFSNFNNNHVKNSNSKIYASKLTVTTKKSSKLNELEEIFGFNTSGTLSKKLQKSDSKPLPAKIAGKKNDFLQPKKVSYDDASTKDSKESNKNSKKTCDNTSSSASVNTSALPKSSHPSSSVAENHEIPLMNKSNKDHLQDSVAETETTGGSLSEHTKKEITSNSVIESLKSIEENYFEVTVQKNAKDLTNSKFIKCFCLACQRRLKSQRRRTHAKSAAHQSNLMVLESMRIIFTYDLDAFSIERLNNFLENMYREKCVDSTLIIDGVKQISGITNAVIGGKFFLFGTCVTGASSKDDLNVDVLLEYTEKVPFQKVLSSISETIQARFGNVTEHLDTRSAHLSFFHDGVNTRLWFKTHAQLSMYRISEVLFDKDLRCRKLALLFLSLMHINSFDEPRSGGFSEVSILCMVLHYLQHVKIIPSNFVKEDGSIDFRLIKNFKTSNTQSLASLWLGILQFYLYQFISVDGSFLTIKSDAPLFIPDIRKSESNIPNEAASSLGLHYFCSILCCALLQSLRVVNASVDNSKLLSVKSNVSSNVYDEMTIEDCVKFCLMRVIASIHRRNEILSITEYNSYVFPKLKPFPFCRRCILYQHSFDECPRTLLFPIVPLPSITSEWMNKLNNFCIELKEQFMPTKEEGKQKRNIAARVRKIIWETFRCNGRVRIFGSSANGFGSKHADLDLCLSLGHANDAEDELDHYVKPLNMLYKRMNEKYVDEFSDIQLIDQARVPILKFHARAYGIDCDICVDNVLALRNTELLKAYTLIDERVVSLGHLLKVFIQKCGISDASLGRLSTYAYMLMLIYFLQRVTPPVLPCLQDADMFKFPLSEENFMEGHDTNFFDGNVAECWTGHKANKCSVGELWIQFFVFYVEKFPFSTDVVSIRRLARMTRFEKDWFQGMVAIEDPFELNRNLGSNIKDTVYKYMMNTFIKARTHFSTPCNKCEDFMNTACLTSNIEPPQTVRCRICRKTGHTQERCPMK